MALSIDMDLDAPADFGMDVAMDFDMGGDFVLDDGLARVASDSSLVAGSTGKTGKNKQVRCTVSSDILL